MRRAWLPWLAALLVVTLTLPAMWPFLSHDGYWKSHDGLFHLYRLLSLEAAWQQGHLYPRLFPDFAFGYGFAVLNFYGPLSYYIALAVQGLGVGAVAAMRLTFALSYPLAALSLWWLARDLWRGPGAAPNEAAGLLGAAIYTYLPYHMADVQLRGALAESWAFVWWPLLFWATWQVRRWPLALALTGLVLTHNLSVILVAFPLALWALLVWRARPDKRYALREWALAGVSALLLSVPYWLPVLLQSSAIWIAQDVGGLGSLNHLAPWQAWLAPSASYRYFPEQGVAAEHPLSWAQLALLGASLLALPWLWRSRWRWAGLFWGGLLLASLFLLTPASAPLWETFVFPFGLVQYPWRWLGVSALAMAMLGSAPLARWPLRPSPLVGLALGVLTLWLAFSSMEALPWESLAVDPAQHPATMWQEDAAVGQVGATWTAEFLPLTVQEQRWALARAPELIPNLGERTPLRVRRGWSDGFTLGAEVESDAPAWLLFPRFAYPSMRVTLDGTSQPMEARGVMGLAAVRVPAGSHRVELAAYPLAAHPWLARLLWLPALGFLLYALWRVEGRARLALLLLAGGLALLLLRQPAPWRVQEPGLQIGTQAQLLSLRYPSLRDPTRSTLPITLLWFNLEQSDQPYSSYLHLTAPGGGPPLAQHDGVPNMGTVPVPRWLPGQLVEDLHLLPLPAGLPAGEYELWGGLYLPTAEGPQPLPGDSGERRFLGRITLP